MVRRFPSLAPAVVAASIAARFRDALLSGIVDSATAGGIALHEFCTMHSVIEGEPVRIRENLESSGGRWKDVRDRSRRVGLGAASARTRVQFLSTPSNERSAGGFARAAGACADFQPPIKARRSAPTAPSILDLRYQVAPVTISETWNSIREPGSTSFLSSSSWKLFGQ